MRVHCPGRDARACGCTATCCTKSRGRRRTFSATPSISRSGSPPSERSGRTSTRCARRMPSSTAVCRSGRSNWSGRTNGLRVEIAERERAEEHRERALIEQRDTLAFLGGGIRSARAGRELSKNCSRACGPLPVPFAADWTMVHVLTEDGADSSGSRRSSRPRSESPC